VVDVSNETSLADLARERYIFVTTFRSDGY
jgi:hypothetical protein